MSLIHDALKTAQRESARQAKNPTGSQPLLEGFFPYVSTSPAQGGGSRNRLMLIAVVLVLVLGVGAWFTAPAIKAALNAPPKQLAAGRPPRQQPPEPVVTPAGAPEQQVGAAAAPSNSSSTDSAASQLATADALTEQSAPEKPRGQPVIAGKSAAANRTRTIQPSETAAPSPEAGSGSVAAARPNLEAEAVAAFSVGDYQTARGRFEAALRTAPTAAAWVNYGVTLEKLGEGRAAADAYQKAMGIDPSYLKAWLYLARMYAAAGDVQRAVPLFNRALEIDPANSDVNADLAELEFKLGAFSEARRYADVAARSNRSNPRAHYYLALAADTLKDRDGARRSFEDFLSAIAGQEQENSASVGYARVRLQELKGKP